MLLLYLMMVGKAVILSSTLLIFTTLAVDQLIAGPYTDDLSKCLLSKSTNTEKATLIEWIFSAISLNPKISQMTSVSPAQRTKIYTDTAKLLENLMTICKTEVQQAVKYEGINSVKVSFGKLGEFAAEELFTSPKVVEGIAEMSSFIDKKKLEAIFAPAK
jgi:hypothetical protein